MNDFYDHSTYPSLGAPPSSAAMRAELDLIEAGFDKMPTMTGNGDEVIVVNSAGTALTSVAKDASGAIPGLTLFKLNLMNAAGTIKSWFTTAATVARTWTMPDKDGTVAMVSDITATQAGLGNVDNTSNATERAATATLTNKTIALGSNTVSGTLAQFNTAVTDADLVSLAGSETLTNKTLTSPVINTPTGIVKGDVGLGNVDNTSDANKPVSTAQATADGVVLSSAAADATSKANAAAAASTPVAHATNTSNPHSVTATQVGLGNVDNTSDVNKPVSTAQALADTAIGSAAAADATSKANAAIVIAEAYADALSVSVVKLNPRIVTSNLTIASTYNAASVGPITIAEGITVTVSDNATWSIT